MKGYGLPMFCHGLYKLYHRAFPPCLVLLSFQSVPMGHPSVNVHLLRFLPGVGFEKDWFSSFLQQGGWR